MNLKWWQKAVGYIIYPRSFKDTNDDGVGDLKGIISKLDYLKELGVDLLWICPFFASPMDDNGYDVSNYYEIDPLFGTNEDFDLLIKEAHARNIRVIVDFVLNHTSDEHEWFK
ncbi:MAG: alpha-amylase family glycosyl hydrolase, partial [Bacilli bacterium]|nr:alpha-amylase family glycosyl hydrolase [Bacilli bacterium]